MATELILMPDIDTRGDVIEFCVAVGDTLIKGDSILIVESDKASIEIPSPVEGIVKELLVEPGTTVSTDHALIRVEPITLVSKGNSGETFGTESKKHLNENEEQQNILPDITTSQPSLLLSSNDISGSVTGPSTRKLARELGIDLSCIEGTGTRSRISKEDVKRYARKKNAINSPEFTDNIRRVQGIPDVDFAQFGEIEHRKLSGIAKATADHMARCWSNIPHVTMFDEVNISELELFRNSIDLDFFGLEKKPSVLPFIIKAITKALRQFPQFNVSLHSDGKQVIYKDYVHIGIAVDTQSGLVVPVIRNADKMTISELAREVQTLSIKARARKLKPEDLQGASFTISSLGPSGGTGFTPIINAPEVAILGVARSEVKPVWNGDKFIPATKIPLCLSFDHRAINGADAGRFLSMVHQCLARIGNIMM